MEHQKILHLLNEESNSKYVTRKWNIVNDQSNVSYDSGKETIYNTEVLKSNLCDFNDAYIFVKGYITIAGHIAARVAFKNCAPFTKCFTEFDGTTTGDADDLDLVMSMYNLFFLYINYMQLTQRNKIYNRQVLKMGVPGLK